MTFDSLFYTTKLFKFLLAPPRRLRFRSCILCFHVSLRWAIACSAFTLVRFAFAEEEVATREDRGGGYLRSVLEQLLMTHLEMLRH